MINKLLSIIAIGAEGRIYATDEDGNLGFSGLRIHYQTLFQRGDFQLTY
jgi:hypothetical protein